MKCFAPTIACLVIALGSGQVALSQTLRHDNPLPDARSVIAGPPQAGSPRQRADGAISQQVVKTHSGQRWELARNDADQSPANLLRTFSCAAGFSIDAGKAPHLVKIMHSFSLLLKDRVGSAKIYWGRARPFQGNHEAICAGDKAQLISNPSYPSGHTVTGWVTALLMAVLLPDRQNELLARARIIGASRVVCNAHWASDVEAAMILGGAYFPVLENLPATRKEMPYAIRELSYLRKAGRPLDAQGCVHEGAAASEDAN